MKSFFSNIRINELPLYLQKVTEKGKRRNTIGLPTS